MYANRIWLVGNEHGVGVRNAGKIGAQAGELVVTADGRLQNIGAMHAQQDLRIDASGGIANAGTLSAERELRLQTPQDADNSGGTLNARRIEVNADALRNRGGSIEQLGTQVLQLQAADLSNLQGRIGNVASTHRHARYGYARYGYAGHWWYRTGHAAAGSRSAQHCRNTEQRRRPH
ncbi:hypothetical protein G6F62_013134 [Rhizopus arrhizus]|nr:hypothetical protein G6F62_013134 [Rhizopus arrhizus]